VGFLQRLSPRGYGFRLIRLDGFISLRGLYGLPPYGPRLFQNWSGYFPSGQIIDLNELICDYIVRLDPTWGYFCRDPWGKVGLTKEPDGAARTCQYQGVPAKQGPY
jgi:hypothetical protein